MRDLNPGDVHDVPPFSLEGGGCGCDFSPDGKELAFTENVDPEPAICQREDFYARSDDPACKAREGEHIDRRELSIRLIRRMGSGWRGGRRSGRGMRATNFGWWFMTGRAKTSKDLLPKFDNWVDEFAWGPIRRIIYFICGRNGRISVFVADSQWVF